MSSYPRRGQETDAELEKKLQQRRTIDYFTPVGKHMIMKNVYNRRRRRAFPTGLIRPDISYFTDMPPSLISSNSIVDLSSKFVHISTNKSKHAIHAVKWTPDARRVLVSSYSGEFTLWNGLTFNFESIMQAHDLPIFSLEYSHNGKWLLSGDQSGCIKFWQPNFNNVNILNKAHEDSIQDLCFSPNDSKFLSCSDDQTLKIWDFSTSKEESVLKGHHWDVKSCDWHSSLGLVVSGSKDNLVKFWDPRDGKCISTLHDFKHTVTKTTFQKGGNERLLAACSRDHSTRIFDIRMLRSISIIKSENEADLTSISWHPIHSTMLTIGAYDGSLSHYDITKTTDIEKFNDKINRNKNLGGDKANNEAEGREDIADEEEDDDDGYDVMATVNIKNNKGNEKVKDKENDNKKVENDISEYVFAEFSNRNVPIVTEAWHSIPHAHDKAIYTIQYHPLGHMLCTAGADKSMRFWCRSRPNDENGFNDNAYGGEGLLNDRGAIGRVSDKSTNETKDEHKLQTVEGSNGFVLPGLSIPGFS